MGILAFYVIFGLAWLSLPVFRDQFPGISDSFALRYWAKSFSYFVVPGLLLFFTLRRSKGAWVGTLLWGLWIFTLCVGSLWTVSMNQSTIRPWGVMAILVSGVLALSLVVFSSMQLHSLLPKEEKEEPPLPPGS